MGTNAFYRFFRTYSDARRCIAAVLFSCISALFGFAQTHYESRVFVGAHGGLNMSRVQFTPGVTQSFLTAGCAGVNFRYVEEKHFGFIVELNWQQMGWCEDFEDLPYSYKRRVNYLQLPFLAHIYFGSRGKFFINAGPSVSLRLNESTSANFDYNNVSTIPDLRNRITYQLNMPVHQRVDYGIAGGLGGEFSITPRHSLYLEGRFYYGLGNMLKSGRTENIRGSNSMSISVTAGYWFRAK